MFFIEHNSCENRMRIETTWWKLYENRNFMVKLIGVSELYMVNIVWKSKLFGVNCMSIGTSRWKSYENRSNMVKIVWESNLQRMRIETTWWKEFMLFLWAHPPTHIVGWQGYHPAPPPATPLFSWQCVGATQEYLLVRISNLLAVSSLAAYLEKTRVGGSYVVFKSSSEIYY